MSSDFCSCRAQKRHYVGFGPHGLSIWNGKPGGVITTSPGAVGGFGANHHLRQMVVFLNLPVMQQPEAYLGRAGEFFSQSGALTNERTREFLVTFMNVNAHGVKMCLAAGTARQSPELALGRSSQECFHGTKARCHSQPKCCRSEAKDQHWRSAITRATATCCDEWR